MAGHAVKQNKSPSHKNKNNQISVTNRYRRPDRNKHQTRPRTKNNNSPTTPQAEKIVTYQKNDSIPKRHIRNGILFQHRNSRKRTSQTAAVEDVSKTHQPTGHSTSIEKLGTLYEAKSVIKVAMNSVPLIKLSTLRFSFGACVLASGWLHPSEITGYPRKFRNKCIGPEPALVG